MNNEDWRKDLPAWVREHRPLDERGWFTEFRMTFVLDYLDQQSVYARRMRLFVSACCRRVWDLLPEEAARQIVELSEAYADDEATEVELQAAYNSPDFTDLDVLDKGIQSEVKVHLSACVVDALRSARSLALPTEGIDSYLIVQNTSRDRSRDFIRSSHNYQIGRSPGSDDAEFGVKENLLRDIFGNPFQPVSFSPEWRTDTTMSLARTMYQSRDFSAMPILADALEDAGCTDADILDHLRGPDFHVRGCWVIDPILCKS